MVQKKLTKREKLGYFPVFSPETVHYPRRLFPAFPANPKGSASFYQLDANPFPDAGAVQAYREIAGYAHSRHERDFSVENDMIIVFRRI